MLGLGMSKLGSFVINGFEADSQDKVLAMNRLAKADQNTTLEEIFPLMPTTGAVQFDTQEADKWAEACAALQWSKDAQ
eukprot:4509138-Karenia_brevis.AAC.1